MKFEHVELRDFNRNPNRYIQRAYQLNMTIHVVKGDGHIATLRGAGLDHGLRLKAARWSAGEAQGSQDE